MQPLFDNLNVIKRQFAANSTEVKRIEDMQKSEQLVIEALAFIRGRSLSEMYCIIDEAQNLTPNEIKTIITRAGEGTKMVFTGDIQQIDQPYLDSQSKILHSSFLFFVSSSSFLIFFLTEIFKELCTFERIDALNVFNIQFSFELSDAFETFPFHPCR